MKDTAVLFSVLAITSYAAPAVCLSIVSAYQEYLLIWQSPKYDLLGGVLSSGGVFGTVSDTPLALCSQVGGTFTSDNVCSTATGTNIGLSPYSTDAMPLATLIKDGAADGSAITVPMADTKGVLSSLGM